MKRPILLALILLSFLGVSAQNISVKSFQPLPYDGAASSLNGKRIDQNGEVAAIIKVVTTETGFSFEGGRLGIVDTQQRNGEIWVWVPRASRRITILHQKFGVLRNYEFPLPIEAERTYEMVLATGWTETVVHEMVTEQFLVFNITPKDAMVTVNGTPWPVVDGVSQKMVEFGDYEYRIEASDYHLEAGRVKVDNPDNKVVLTIALKPAYGFLKIEGNRDILASAMIYVDNANGAEALKGPMKLASGNHKVRVVHPKYKPYERTVTITDNENTLLKVNLDANYSTVTLKVDDNAEIWVNNEKKGVRSWTGDLEAGNYIIECRKTNHRSTSVKKTITENMGGQTIQLQAPSPINGTLVVNSNPPMAKIVIDGKQVGETPQRINAILIGEHTLRLEKQGCAPLTKTFTIEEGKTLNLDERLDKVIVEMNEGGMNNGPKNEETFTVNNALKSEETFTVNSVSFTMKLVEGGTFQMGATSEQGSDADNWEKPVHNVTVSNYYIGETEVTQGLWKAVMSSNPSNFKGDNLPVEQVSWNDVQDFIRKLNQITGKDFRLPTEAEWEYAARGGKKSKGTKYAGSNTIGNVAWYTDNSGGKTHAVKTKLPNELGLYDMSGNVWEWCSDVYGSYSSGSQTNPKGASSGWSRVMRGGSWSHIARRCRVSSRINLFPGNKYADDRFRLALSE